VVFLGGGAKWDHTSDNRRFNQTKSLEPLLPGKSRFQLSVGLSSFVYDLSKNCAVSKYRYKDRYNCTNFLLCSRVHGTATRCVIPYSSYTYFTVSQLNFLPPSDSGTFVPCPTGFTSFRNCCRQSATLILWWWRTHDGVSSNHVWSRRNGGHQQFDVHVIGPHTSVLICSSNTLCRLARVPKLCPYSFSKAQPLQNFVLAAALIPRCLSTFITWRLFL